MEALFSSRDHVIARSLMKQLPPKQRKAVVLRFWHNYSIFEIAKSLRVTWVEADKILSKALVKMKRECVKQPHFSKSKKLSLVA